VFLAPFWEFLVPFLVFIVPFLVFLRFLRREMDKNDRKWSKNGAKMIEKPNKNDQKIQQKMIEKTHQK
jgi:hypothetical protein